MMQSEEKPEELLNNWTNINSVKTVDGESVKLIHIWITVGLMVAIILIGIIANSMVILAVYRTVSLQTVTNVFVVNLGVCDILFVSAILPFNIYTYIKQGWFLSDWICEAVGFMAYTFTGTTLMTISMIAWVRYQLVTNSGEYKHRFCKRNVYVMISATWLLPALCQFPAVCGLWGRFGYVPVMASCNLLLDHSSQSFKIFLLVMRAIIPSALIIYCYFIINYTTRRSHHKLIISQPQRLLNTTLEDKINKKELQLTRTTSILFIVFALSYFPCTISGIVDWNNMLSKTFHLYCELAVYVGSSCNPLVYGLLNKQFRKAYIRLLQPKKTSSTVGRVTQVGT